MKHSINGTWSRLTALLLCLVALLGLFPSRAIAQGEEEVPFTLVGPARKTDGQANLTDSDGSTRFTLRGGEQLSLSWEGEVQGVLLQWYDVYGQAVLRFVKDGAVIQTQEYGQLSYRMLVQVPAGADGLEIVCGKNSLISLCEVRLLASGQMPTCLTVPGTVDLMLLCGLFLK